jgi:hypothetical protein
MGALPSSLGAAGRADGALEGVVAGRTAALDTAAPALAPATGAAALAAVAVALAAATVVADAAGVELGSAPVVALGRATAEPAVGEALPPGGAGALAANPAHASANRAPKGQRARKRVARPLGGQGRGLLATTGDGVAAPRPGQPAG